MYKYICCKEIVDNVEMSHCQKEDLATRDIFVLSEVPEELGTFLWHKIFGADRAPSTVTKKFFSTRQEALDALTTLDPDHGLF